MMRSFPANGSRPFLVSVTNGASGSIGCICSGLTACLGHLTIEMENSREQQRQSHLLVKCFMAEGNRSPVFLLTLAAESAAPAMAGCAEAFNALNHPRFDAPNTNPSSPNFGRVTPAQLNNARQIELGGRPTF